MFQKHSKLSLLMMLMSVFGDGSQGMMSVLGASIIYMVPHLMMAKRYFNIRYDKARQILLSLYGLEVGKIVMSVVGFTLIFLWCPLDATCFFVAYMAHLMMGIYWWAQQATRESST